MPQSLTSVLAADTALSVIIYDTDALFVNLNSSAFVASSVVSLTVKGITSGQLLPAPIEITFVVSNASLAPSARCVYYDFSNVAWQTDGCTKVAFNNVSNAVTCSCSHLTNFAVLLDQSGGVQELSAADQLALNFITTIGCSISIALMGIFIIGFLIYSVRCMIMLLFLNHDLLDQELRTKAKGVIMHLCLCLMVAQVVFLAGVDKTSPRLNCSIIAAVLQYFLLAAFMV